MSVLLPLTVIVPLGVGFLLALTPRRFSAWSDILAVCAGGALLIFSFMLLGYQGTYDIGGWGPPVGINLSIDHFSWLMLLSVSVVSFCVLLFSAGYMRMYTSRTRYYVLFMMMLAGMNGTILAGDIFNRFVYIELAAMASYVLVGFACAPKGLFAAFRYAVFGAVASSTTLLGIALLYGMHGTVNIAFLAESIQKAGDLTVPFTASFLAVMLIFVGFGFKAAIMPFHIWQPDAMEFAPAGVAAMISGALIGPVSVYALLRTVFAVFGINVPLGWILAGLGVISMLGGAFFSLRQQSYRRMLSYQSVSQIGFVLLGVGLGGQLFARSVSPAAATLALAGGIFHLVNISLFNPVLFMDAGIEEHARWANAEDKGPGKEKFPVTTAVAMLAASGVPPIGGAASKIMIIAACFMAGHHLLGVLAVLAAAAVLLSFWRRIGDVEFSLRGIVTRAPLFMKFPVFALAGLCFLIAVVAAPVVRKSFLDPAAESLLEYHIDPERNEIP